MHTSRIHGRHPQAECECGGKAFEIYQTPSGGLTAKCPHCGSLAIGMRGEWVADNANVPKHPDNRQ